MSIPLIAVPIIQSLLKNGLSTLAEAALAKGQEWVEEKTGVKLETAVNSTPEQLTQLRLAQMKHEETLQEGILEGRRISLEELRAYFSDAASARDREAKVVSSTEAPYLNKIITPVLALFILAAAFAGIWWLVELVDGEFNPTQTNVIMYVLGAITSMATQVISYYFGASKGDAAKDQTLKDLLKHDKS